MILIQKELLVLLFLRHGTTLSICRPCGWLYGQNPAFVSLWTRGRARKQKLHMRPPPSRHPSPLVYRGGTGRAAMFPCHNTTVLYAGYANATKRWGFLNWKAVVPYGIASTSRTTGIWCRHHTNLPTSPCLECQASQLKKQEIRKRRSPCCHDPL